MKRGRKPTGKLLGLTQAEKSALWRKENPTKYEALKLRTRTRNYQIKERVLTYYGNGKLACVGCGFNNIRALSIDHIGNGGNRHRRKLKVSGSFQFYMWLERNGLPTGYQTLCFNCQWIKRPLHPEKA